jgi:hypothetical protein
VVGVGATVPARRARAHGGRAQVQRLEAAREGRGAVIVVKERDEMTLLFGNESSEVHVIGLRRSTHQSLPT